MKDIKGKEIKVGDEVAYTVGTNLLYGNVIAIREIRQRPSVWNPNPSDAVSEALRVSLPVPQTVTGYKTINGEYTPYTKVKMWRDVFEAWRVIVLG